MHCRIEIGIGCCFLFDKPSNELFSAPTVMVGHGSHLLAICLGFFRLNDIHALPLPTTIDGRMYEEVWVRITGYFFLFFAEE